MRLLVPPGKFQWIFWLNTRAPWGRWPGLPQWPTGCPSAPVPGGLLLHIQTKSLQGLPGDVAKKRCLKQAARGKNGKTQSKNGKNENPRNLNKSGSGLMFMGLWQVGMVGNNYRMDSRQIIATSDLTKPQEHYSFGGGTHDIYGCGAHDFFFCAAHTIFWFKLLLQFLPCSRETRMLSTNSSAALAGHLLISEPGNKGYLISVLSIF